MSDDAEEAAEAGEQDAAPSDEAEAQHDAAPNDEAPNDEAHDDEAPDGDEDEAPDGDDDEAPDGNEDEVDEPVDQLGIPMRREPTLDDVRSDGVEHRQLALGCSVLVSLLVLAFWLVRGMLLAE